MPSFGPILITHVTVTSAALPVVPLQLALVRSCVTPFNWPPSKPHTYYAEGLLAFWVFLSDGGRKVNFKHGFSGHILKNDSCPRAERASFLHVLLAWPCCSNKPLTIGLGALSGHEKPVKQTSKWASHFWVKPWVLAASPELDPGHMLSVVMKLKTEMGKVQMFVPH